MQGHIGAVLTLTVSCDGDFIASSGKDRSLRFWQRSHEVVIPSEEREREREEEEEKVLPKSQEARVGFFFVIGISLGLIEICIIHE